MNDKLLLKTKKIFLDYLIPPILVCGISLVIFQRVVAIQGKKEISYPTFTAFNNGVEGYYEFKTAWKPRLFSNALATLVADMSDLILNRMEIPLTQNKVELTIGLWTVSWFVTISFVLILTFKRRAIFYILGIFAGISFGYNLSYHTVIFIYPWDMTALFFYLIFILLFIYKKYFWLIPVIALGMGFKETIFILCFAFLFADLPWNPRVFLFISSMLLAIIVKISIDLYTHAPLFFTMETKWPYDSSRNLYVFENLLVLKEITPLFVNSGLLMILFFCPTLNREIRAFKSIALLFIAGNMMFSVITEYRIWFEMLPLSLYTLDYAIYGNPIISEDSMKANKQVYA